jgi:hypothetical protein
MAEDGYDRSQLFQLWVQPIHGQFELVLGAAEEVVEVGVQVDFLGEEVVEDLLLQYGWAVLPILRVAFNKRPPIDVTHVGFAIGSQQIKPTDLLLKLLYYPVAHKFLSWGQVDRKPHLLSLLVALNYAIEGGWFACLGIHVVWSDGVDLDIEGVGG